MADLLLHVVDGAHGAALEHVAAVETVLEQIGAGSVPRILVINKIDQVMNMGDVRMLERDGREHVMVSAETGAGVEALGDAVARHLVQSMPEIEVRITDPENGWLVHLDRVGIIKNKVREGDDSLRLCVALSQSELRQVRAAIQHAPGLELLSAPGENGAPRPD
jgi:GTP-binding protein HflX